MRCNSFARRSTLWSKPIWPLSRSMLASQTPPRLQAIADTLVRMAGLKRRLLTCVGNSNNQGVALLRVPWLALLRTPALHKLLHHLSAWARMLSAPSCPVRVDKVVLSRPLRLPRSSSHHLTRCRSLLRDSRVLRLPLRRQLRRRLTSSTPRDQPLVASLRSLRRALLVPGPASAAESEDHLLVALPLLRSTPRSRFRALQARASPPRLAHTRPRTTPGWHSRTTLPTTPSVTSMSSVSHLSTRRLETTGF